MNSVSNITQNFLDSRQIFEGIKKVFPDSEKHSAAKWADMFAWALNKQLVKKSDGEMYRCSKLDGSEVNQPFTLYFSGNKDFCDLYFLPNSSHVKVRRGAYKKVKDLFFLRISKEDPKDLPSKVVDLVLYRVQASGIFEVKKGLAMHKKIIENCDPKYFVAFPVVFPVYLGEKGIKKLEMASPRYIGDMEESISENFLSLSDKIDLCLDVAQGICLLGKLTPPIVHRDLKLDNILLEKSEEEDRIRALIADFDKATHPDSKDRRTPTFSIHLNFLTSRGQYSVEGDAYSLAILIGKVFLDGFSLVMRSNFNEENVVDRVQSQMGFSFFSLGKFKKKVSSECAKKVEEIFLGEKQVQNLLLYAKTLGNTPESSLVKKFTFELAVFKPIFSLLLRTLREEQKAKESVLRQGLSIEEAAREFHPPSAEEIVQVLEKCKAEHLLLEGFLEGKIGEKDLSAQEEEGHLFR